MLQCDSAKKIFYYGEVIKLRVSDCNLIIEGERMDSACNLSMMQVYS